MSLPDTSYQDTVDALAGDAEQLEQVYQTALKVGKTEAFKEAIEAGHASAPDNLLYAAWFYRLKHTAVRAKEYAVAWAWAIPLALANALLFWWLSGEQFMIAIESFQGLDRDFLPVLFWLAAPLSALFVLIYFTVVGRKNWRLSIPISILLFIAAGYVLLFYPQMGTEFFQEQYLTLMIMHLPLLAWAGVGAFLVARHRDPENRFAFLIKSLEVSVVGGLFAIAGLLFTGITAGLFQALNVELPDEVVRLFFAGGLGFIAVVATAVIYNPAVPPAEQAFDEGLSKLVALLMRVLLPLALLVGIVYLVFIAFNFRAPFDNREVLVIYNIMLFAIVALLVGATPVSLQDISPRVARWLRWGIIAVAALALLVSLYALAAIVYRTSIDRLTPNRLAIIGWNIVNIGLLVVLLFLQLRGGDGQWLHELHRAFSMGTVAYAAWTLVVILALPWLFGIDQGVIEELPLSVQRAVYDYPDPVLLKCYNSPHIYLLENGQKRWIDTIETFENRGYVWRDVRFVPCQDLRAVPDGVPIPPDAGPPPQPWGGSQDLAPDPTIIKVGDPIPVVIDTDMSHDDVMAILYLLAHPNVEVLAISVTGTGVAHCQPGVANALGLVALSGQKDIPVTCGREKPLTGEHAFPSDWRQNADAVWGVDLPTGDEAVSVSAPELLADTIPAAGETITIAALGPLTNIAEAFQETPEIISGIEMLYVMGGALDVPGNIAQGTDIKNDVADWNIYADPRAANIVFSSDAPITLVPLDGTQYVPVTHEFIAVLKQFNNTPQANVVLEILSANSFFIGRGYQFWDPLAAAVLTDESLVTIEEYPLEVVEEEGPESGRILRADEGPPIRVVKSADKEQFEQLFLTVLNWPE